MVHIFGPNVFTLIVILLVSSSSTTGIYPPCPDLQNDIAVNDDTNKTEIHKTTCGEIQNISRSITLETDSVTAEAINTENDTINKQNMTREIDEIMTTATRKARNWLTTERDESRGWKDETHRAIISLALSDPHQLVNSNIEHLELTLKQLDLQIALALAKKSTHIFSFGQLALYINALLAVCRNPRDFYGINLLSKLHHRHDAVISQYEFALSTLTLCNAGVQLRNNHLLQLIEMLPDNSSMKNGEDDHQILAILALQCATQNYRLFYLKRYVDRSLSKIRRIQNSEDGGFGNIYTSALIIQALLEAGDNAEWDREAGLSYLVSHQRDDGSIAGNLLATFFALPPMSGQTLVSISRMPCTTTVDIVDKKTEPLEEQNTTAMAVTLSIWTPQLNLSKIVFVQSNISLYDVVSRERSSYRFNIKAYSWGHYVTGINDLEEDTAEQMHWFIYKHNSTDHTITALENGIDETHIEDEDHYVFFYKKMK